MRPDHANYIDYLQKMLFELAELVERYKDGDKSVKPRLNKLIRKILVEDRQ